jgi:hypothetical protein
VRSLAERQRDFAAALLDPRLPTPAGCVAPDGHPDSKRFAVYRNNVASSLIDAMADAYPAIRRLLGEECFRGTARSYVAQDPPRSPVLLEYGAGFPGFLAAFEPLGSLPYLADVARIERAWLEAYHAPEAASLEPSALTGISDQRAADLCFTLHPSLRIVRSPFPALTIWRMNVAAGEPRDLSLDAGGEDALITRAEAEVEARALPPGGAIFIGTLAGGKSLGEAALVASRADGQFNLTDHLTGLLESGLIIAGRLRRQRTRVTRHDSHAS